MRLVEDLDTWLEERVDVVRSDFLDAVHAGDPRAHEYIDRFEVSLAARLAAIRDRVMDETTRMLDAERRDRLGPRPSLDIDTWITLAVDRLRVDYFDEYDVREDENDARAEFDRFRTLLARRLDSIQDDVMAELTVALDEELKAEARSEDVREPE
jgi:hypothetical protein